MNIKQAKPKRRPVYRPGGGSLLNTPELARAIGESTTTIKNMRRDGIIPYLDLGHRRKRYNLADVLRALDKRTVKPRAA
jgi:hypothetical protein